MASSLSQQLKKLATPQTSILDHKKKTVSILFSPAEAANYTKDTYYEIGLSGFNELSEVNEKFLKFKESLFGQKTKEFQRVVQTKEVNDELNKNIEEFLLLLSPYLQKQASLKAMEWLIQRYYINELNVSALMMCILPYYETILFIRILQIVDIRSDRSPWNWLNKSQHKGRPIAKQTVFQHWASDQWFRNFISKYFRKMIKVSSDDNHLQVASSFLIMTQIGGLAAAQKVTENHLSSICQTLQLCLKSENIEVLSGTLIMISQLVFSTQLAPDLLETIVEKLVKIQDSSMVEYSCLCLLNLFYHQEFSVVSTTVLEVLEKNPAFLTQISKVSEQKTVASFMASYTRASVRYILSDESLKESEKKKKLENLVEFIETMPLVSGESCKVIRAFIHGLSDCKSECKALQKKKTFPAMLKKLETSHPDGFDKACASIVNGTELSENMAFEQLIIETFQKKYIVSMKSIAVSEIKKKEITQEEQWETLQWSKLTTNSMNFLKKILNSISLSDVDKNWLVSIQDTESETRSNVISVIKLLNIVLFHQVNETNNELCDLVLKHLFKVQLGDRKSKLYFLSLIWGSDLESKNGIGVIESLKIWALKLASSLLKTSSPKSGSLSWVLDSTEPLVPSLFIPVCEGGVACASAFQVLEEMLLINGARLRPSSLSVLVEEIVTKKMEISVDSSYLPSTVAHFVFVKKNRSWKMIENLLEFVDAPDALLHFKTSVLYSLSDINNPEIFSRLIPTGNSLLEKVENLQQGLLDRPSSLCLYYVLLRFSSDNALFLELKGGWELFLRSLALHRPVLDVTGEVFSPQELVVNYKLLRAISTSDKLLEVLDILITRITNTNNVNEALKLRRELKKISLESTQIISLLNKYELVQKFKSVKEARAKKLKQQKEDTTEKTIANWRKLELIIELIGVMSDMKEPWLLIGPICDHLKSLIKVESSLSDTLQQQMLSVCHHLLEVSSKQLDEKEFVKKCKLNVALIVQTIRTSVNPDTHRRALLILSLASKYFPDQVLHNIMAIFTFMGTSLLRRDDSYSFQVIHLTITSIVPTLIQAESSDPNELLKKLSQVTQVFVDALPDLAEHRRLPLFTQLAVTLGVSRYLWLVMVLIADAYVACETSRGEDSSRESDQRRLPRNIKFALILYSQYSVADQLKASCHVVDFVSSLPDDKENSKNLNATSSSTCVINIASRTGRQLRQLKYTCLGLIVQLLTSEKFVGQVYEFSKDNSESELTELRDLYRDLLEKCLCYLKSVAAQEQLMRNSPNGRFWAAMHRKLLDLVDAVNSLLPPPLLVQIISKLINSKLPDIRCRAMEILASKLQPEIRFFNDEETGSLSLFIEPLMEVGLNVTQQENNRQTAFFTLQLLVRRLNAEEPELILPVLGASANLIKDGDPSSKVVTQAALVVAETINVLKIHSVVHLDKLVPAFLSILRDSAEGEDEAPQDNLIIASATALHKIVEHLPRLLPQENLEELLVLCCRLISKQEPEDGGVKETRLTSRLTSTIEHLIRNMELRILIPSLTKTYIKMSTLCVSSLPSLMKVIESLIKFVKPTDLVMFKQQFIALFLGALDARHQQVDVDDAIVRHVEGCVISALTKFLLKMDEDDNITILLNLLNWASDSADQIPSRLTTFFRFANELAGCLKVLFIKAKLAEKVFDFAAQNLERNNSMSQKDTVFGSGRNAESGASELLEYVLETLSKIFLYDSVQFTSEEKFNVILEPLANQIENTFGSDKEFTSRVSNFLKPCIIKFTKAVGDDSLWKEVNRKILLRVITDNDTKIILAGLDVFEGLIEALGEDYLQPVLADTIPYITEVLESMDHDVEAKTKQVYLKMEAIVGDSLKAYLDT